MTFLMNFTVLSFSTIVAIALINDIRNEKKYEKRCKQLEKEIGRIILEKQSIISTSNDLRRMVDNYEDMLELYKEDSESLYRVINTQDIYINQLEEELQGFPNN